MSKSAASVFRSIAKARKSCHRFQPNLEIPENTLKDILDVTLTAPSGFNLQPTQVIILRNQNLKQKLAKTSMLGPGNIYRTIDSSAIAIFLSDLQPHKRLPRIIQLEKEANIRNNNKIRTKQYMDALPIASTFLMGEGNVATFMKQIVTDMMSPIQPMPSIDNVQSWSFKNTSLVAQTMVLAATSHGLETCLMEGYDDRRLKEVLNIPDRYGVPLVCCLGYEFKDENSNENEHTNENESTKGDNTSDMGVEKRTPRLKHEEVFFGDTFGNNLNLEDKKSS
jgi:nitroreductase